MHFPGDSGNLTEAFQEKQFTHDPMTPSVDQGWKGAIHEPSLPPDGQVHRQSPSLRAKAVAVVLLVLGMLTGPVGGDLRGDEAALDLKGRIRTSDGRAVTNANVFILTAGPRVGTGTLCPSCYPDCRKRAQSDQDGQFTIPSVNGSLLFRLLVVAPGFQPSIHPRTDPRTGLLDVVLSARTTNHPPDRTILGRVVDAQGRPMAEAVVSIDVTEMGSSQSSAPPEGTDPLAITDEAGDFALGSAGSFDAMGLTIEARTKAPGRFAGVRPGRQRRTFVLTEGASIVGRVVSAGQPVPNVVIGACGKDRTMGNFVGSFSVATGADGRFALTELPPNHMYFVYGGMESLSGRGTLPLKHIRSGADGATLDLGDLTIRPGHRLAGRLKLSDRDSLPQGTRLLVGRDQAWDWITLTLGADGRFDLANLPPGETLSLSTRVPGYRTSEANGIQNARNDRLEGRLDADKTNLLFVLEPGEARFDALDGEDLGQPARSPLAGAEWKRERPAGWVISGKAVDAETGEPLPRFRVSVGRTLSATDPAFFVSWLKRRGADGTGGRYVVELPRSTKFAVLEAEAEGYLPVRSEALKPGQTNHGFRMTRGNGPSGVVLGVDGRPAAGVAVVHLGSGQQARLPHQGAMWVYNATKDESVTDGLGHFKFSPKYGPSEVWIATEEGFAWKAAKDLTGTNGIQLERWASVHGRIVRDRQGIPDEPIEIRFEGRDGGDRPYVNLEGTRADESGRFHLKRVPPGKLVIATREAIEVGPLKGAWSLVPQLTVHLKPGEDRLLEDLEKSEHGRLPDGTDRGVATTSSQAGFLPWLMPGVLAAGALVALMAFKSGRAR